MKDDKRIKIHRGNRVSVITMILIISLVLSISFFVYKVFIYQRENNEYAKFKQRPVISAQEVKVTDTSTRMEYVEADNLGIKIGYLNNTPERLELIVSFKIPMNIENSRLAYGIAVYDENNNIYGILENINKNEYWKMLYRELNIKYQKNDVWAVQLKKNMGMNYQEVNADKSLSNYIVLEPVNKFPDSKKLYVRIFDINTFQIINNQPVFTPISSLEWDFSFEL